LPKKLASVGDDERSTAVFDLKGRIALVTGAGQGVGAGIARCLGEAGAHVAVNDLVATRAQSATSTLHEIGASAVACPFDVTDAAAVQAAVDGIEATIGPVDILVNNAGVPLGMEVASFRSMDPTTWSRYVDLNLYGVLRCTRAVIDGMCDRRFGRIITVSSGAGTTGLGIGVSLYAAGKGAGISFMRHLAVECASDGVTANTLALGLMGPEPANDPAKDDAPVGDGLTVRMARSIPVGRLGRPSDVGAACVFLASDEAAWITGQTIGVNGGAVTS
jgi:NAD(P)-dependent dehydrogenase (short-subunit alcohol dehydrogenase family)